MSETLLPTLMRLLADVTRNFDNGSAVAAQVLAELQAHDAEQVASTWRYAEDAMSIQVRNGGTPATMVTELSMWSRSTRAIADERSEMAAASRKEAGHV